MGKPSRLKIAIKEMEEELEGYKIEAKAMDAFIKNLEPVLEKLRKIDGGGKDAKSE